MLKKDELTIYLTPKCNLNCKHCYIEPGSTPLTLDDLQWVLENIKNKRTTLLGGEPLLFPYLRDCIDAFPGVTISTNATLIDGKNVGWLKGVNGIQLSAEMGEQETNYIRGDGVWDKVMNAKKLLEKEDIDHYIRVSFWEGNLPMIKEYAEMENTNLVLFPRVGKPPLNEKLTSALFEEVLKRENWILALPNFMQYLGQRGRCKAGTERLNITYNRKITPCNFDFEYHLGKIGDDQETIERNIDFFVKQNKKVPTECIGCKHADVCKGSCKVVNASKGCPLKYNFSLQDFMERYSINKNDMDRHVDRINGFMKKMLVC